jgi:NAD(P)-dependent dehydrogenase (short-subunit alcohol dehydrogenase family)
MATLEDQVILVTGSTDGIGKQTAYGLAQRGATGLLHGRSQEKGGATLREIRDATGNDKLEYYLADFSSLAEVRNLADGVQANHDALDVLINNAGVGAGKRGEVKRELNQDGYELRFAANYLAPYLFTRLLLPALCRAAPSRIVNVASAAQNPIDFDDVMLERRYDGFGAYAQSKLALVMFTFDLAEELKGEDIAVNCLHPGSLLDTKMVREAFGRAMGDVQSGADAVIYLATSSEVEGVTGKYFDQKQEARAHEQAHDGGARNNLRQLSEKLMGSQNQSQLHQS